MSLKRFKTLHRRLEAIVWRLRSAGRYDEARNMIDRWWDWRASQ